MEAAQAEQGGWNEASRVVDQGLDQVSPIVIQVTLIVTMPVFCIL